MAKTSLRTELIETIKPANGTPRIDSRWTHESGAGATIESSDQVLVADLSTQVLGRAKGATANASPKLELAINSNEDNTGV